LKESELLHSLRLAIGQRPDVTIWRNQVGVAQYAGLRVPYGLTRGASDLIGIRTLTITPDMAGQLVGQFVAVEVKTDKGRLTTEQRQFLELVEKRGGLSACVRSLTEATQCFGPL
jgi:hypothetical protein